MTKENEKSVHVYLATVPLFSISYFQELYHLNPILTEFDWFVTQAITES